MQSFKVRIYNSGVGHAIGKNGDGETVFIKNGDLLSQSEIECVFIEKKGERLVAEILETYDNDKVLEGKSDNDTLIYTKFINKVINRNQFLIDNKFVFPDRRIINVIDYLLENRKLWNVSRIFLKGKRSTYSRVVTFGITFKKAIEKLTESGFTKARLICESRKEFQYDGVVAEMLANTHMDKDGNTTLEVWQGVENVKEVFYAHGIMNKEKSCFTHFDCAVINYDFNSKLLLFKKNKKIKSGQYKKLFRIDGSIGVEHIFELANRFFPLDNLIDEYFDIERL